MSDLTPVEQRSVDDFLSLEFPNERGEWIRRLSNEGRKGFYAAFVKLPDLQLEDVLALPEPWRHELNFHLIGNDHPEMKIRNCGRSFAIGPVDQPVKVEDGTSGGQRRWLTIDEPKMLECRKAINCLLQYGKHAEHDHNRGKLRQMSMAEVAKWHADKAEAAKLEVKESKAARR